MLVITDKSKFILGSRQWPVLLVEKQQGLTLALYKFIGSLFTRNADEPDFHAVTLKGHKTENGKLKLNIRDSGRDPNNPAEIWIDENNSRSNQMNLTVMGNGEKMAFYFELS